MSRYFQLQLAAITLALSACVTINVYFPAAAAEKAADKIIEDVLGDAAAKGDKRTSVHEGASQMLLAAAGGVLNFLVPTANAQAQADLNIATPAVRQLTESMEARFAQLKKYLDSGAVGFARDGLVEVRDQNLIPLPERNAVRKLVADENADRASLYREIASANGHPEWETDIRSTFASRWASRAAAGWYVQDSNGNWKQK